MEEEVTSMVPTLTPLSSRGPPLATATAADSPVAASASADPSTARQVSLPEDAAAEGGSGRWVEEGLTARM